MLVGVWDMYALIVLPFLSTRGDSLRGRAFLQLELLALRHQLAVIKRTSPRPIHEIPCKIKQSR